ncbi:MAG TPA: DUF559 domain-containing protein [Acidimicrobiales bacterium]|nr:DUF559 domain-containing protein [Acidimicrobiales bacterium]
MDPERAARQLAEGQHNVITYAQLADCGLKSDQVQQRLDAGVLLAMHRGVYRFAGAAPGRWTELAAAVLACGPGGCASHTSGGALFGLRGALASQPHVTIEGWDFRSRVRGVRIHRTLCLSDHDVTTRFGVRVTTVARTLLDMGAVVPAAVVESAAEDARNRGLVTIDDLEEVLGRLGERGRGGTAALRAYVRDHAGSAAGESELEVRFLRLLRDAGLPRPIVQHQVRIGGRTYRLDAAYPDRLIAFELDGISWHSGRARFSADRARSNALVTAGWRVLHFTWDQAHGTPEAVTAEVAQALALPFSGHQVS